MTYTSNLPSVRAKMARAIDAGLSAMVKVPMERTRRDLMTGYTSGAFTTGTSAEGVRAVDPFSTPEGRAIAYGTDVLSDLFWAIGGQNAYTRQFERVDKWTPHLYASRPEMLTAFRAAYAQAMGA
jgi:hypothetical protein